MNSLNEVSSQFNNQITKVNTIVPIIDSLKQDKSSQKVFDANSSINGVINPYRVISTHILTSNITQLKLPCINTTNICSQCFTNF